MKRRRALTVVLLFSLLLAVLAWRLFGPVDLAQPDVAGGAHGPAPAPGNAESARVAAVIDGDTIRLESGERVRYLGIDTPELGSQQTPRQAFGPEAARRNQELVTGKLVRLEQDAEDRDRFGRLLRHVWLEDRLVAAVLIREGLGYEQLYPPNARNLELLQAAQLEARAAAVGVWSHWPTAAPVFLTPVRPSLLPLANPRAPDCPPGVTEAAAAKALLGQPAQLCLRDLRVDRGTAALFLRARQSRPGSPTLVLFRAVWSQLPTTPERYFDQRTVVARGRVELFENAPEIVIRDLADISLVE